MHQGGNKKFKGVSMNSGPGVPILKAINQSSNAQSSSASYTRTQSLVLGGLHAVFCSGDGSLCGAGGYMRIRMPRAFVPLCGDRPMTKESERSGAFRPLILGTWPYMVEA